MKVAIHSSKLLLTAALCSFFMTGCATSPQDAAPAVSTTQTRSHVEGVPGGVVSQLTTLVATVEKIDYQTREVTLLDPQGNSKTLKISPQATNLDDVQKGDTVRVSYAEELVVFVKEKGAPANTGKATIPAGEKPQVVDAVTQEQTATVKALDIEHQTATLRFPDGGERTFLVREDVKLDKSQIGREIVFRHSEALGISIETR